MDSKETEDIASLNKKREMLLKIQQRIEKATADMKASGPTASISSKLQNLSQEIQQVLMMKTATGQDPSKATLRITYELNKVFDAEEVGHLCNLCSRDLATDPERPNGSLTSLQEACVLAMSTTSSV